MLIDIEKIKVRERIRKDFGDIQELADDIKQNGLINPPVVNKDYELLAGERRLKACKLLGWKAIPVNMMDTRDAEHELNIEISENDVRKGFTKTERVDYMKRLLKIEEAKAKERQGNKTSVENNAEVKRSDEITAEKFEVSATTMRKEIAISDNRKLLDPKDFADWDEGKLSTNKAYQRLKEKIKSLEDIRDSQAIDKRALQRRITELENQPPKTVYQNVEPSDYKEVKSKAKAYDAETNRLNQKIANMAQERNALQEEIKELQKERVQEQAKGSLLSDAVYFISKCGFFIQDVAGYVWLADKLKELPEKEREQYVRAASAVRDWSVALLQSIERDEEYGKPAIQKLIAESTK